MIHNHNYVILDKENLDARIKHYKNGDISFPELLHMLDSNNLNITYTESNELLNFLHEEIIKYNKNVLTNNLDSEFYVLEDDEENDNGSDDYYINIHKIINYKIMDYYLISIDLK